MLPLWAGSLLLHASLVLLIATWDDVMWLESKPCTIIAHTMLFRPCWLGHVQSGQVTIGSKPCTFMIIMIVMVLMAHTHSQGMPRLWSA